MSTLLHLVRHGAVDSRSGKIFLGQMDVPLNADGIAQARVLRSWLEPVRFAHVFSSDLSRAQHTCNIITGRNSIEVLRSLREINLGTWEGCSFDEIKQQFPEEFAARGRDIENWRPPGGESFADCSARVLGALQQILYRADGNVLVVGHAGVNRLILCDVLGIPMARMHRLGQDYGCINVIAYSATQARVQLMNFTPETIADRIREQTEAGIGAAGIEEVTLHA